jgi:PBP1b-binding outer membrane lipoprotein LpoB
VKIALVTVMSALALIGCSNTQVKSTDSDKPNTAETASPPAIVHNTKKPTSFEEYKLWRRSNDPESEAYAEFKAWEAKQREWKVKSEQ